MFSHWFSHWFSMAMLATYATHMLHDRRVPRIPAASFQHSALRAQHDLAMAGPGEDRSNALLRRTWPAFKRFFWDLYRFMTYWNMIYSIYIYICVCVCLCIYIYMWYVFNHPFLRYEIFKILLTYYKSLIVSHFGAHHCHSSSSQVRMGEDVNINWQRARCAVMIRAFTKSSRDLNSK